MGAFVPGTLILASSPEGQALLGQQNAGKRPFPSLAGSGLPAQRSGAGFSTLFTTPGGGGVTPIGIILPIIGALTGLGSGGTLTSAEQTFTNNLHAEFPNTSDAVCGQDLDISMFTLGVPATLNIPCDTPDWGTLSRGHLDYILLAQGGDWFFRQVKQFISSSGSPTSTTGTSATEDIINNNIQLIDTSASDAINNVAAAVQQGIQAGAAAADQVAANTTRQIASTVTSFSNSLFGWARDVGSWIANNLGDALKAIKDNLGGVLDAVYNTLKKAVTETISVLDKHVGDILGNIAQVLKDATDFYNKHIQPLVTAIQTSISTVAAVETDIRDALKGGLKGILNLPAELSAQLSGLAGAYDRAKAELSAKTDKVTSSIAYDKTLNGLPNHFAAMVDALTGVTKAGVDSTYRPSSETLTEPTLQTELPKVLDAMNQIMKDLAIGMWKILQDPAKTGELVVGVGTAIYAEIFSAWEVVMFLWEIMHESLAVPGELAAERVRELIPIEKLTYTLLQEAYQRGFISAEQMDKELLVQGYNGDRSKLLRDLTTYRFDQSTLSALRFRGIITDGDYVRGLYALGFTPAQVDAFRQVNLQLTTPQEATEALRRQIIDPATWDTILTANRYDDAERDLLKRLAFRPLNVQEANRAVIAETLVGQLTGQSLQREKYPSWFTEAATFEGIDSDSQIPLFDSLWFTPDVATVIQEYFRGLRTLPDVHAVMEANHIHPGFYDELIQVQRPLIPFRTIPSLVAAGIVGEADARVMLEKHGFDSASVNYLMEYAQRSRKSASATTTAAAHGTSLAAARTLFNDGAITIDQYRELLVEHGLSTAAIDAEVQVAQITETISHRKQMATDIVNEYAVGSITKEDASQQLAQLGLTVAEQARYQRQMKTVKTAVSKIPSEGDLNHMMQTSVISQDDYQAALEAQGYSAKWAAAFRAWRTNTAPNQTAAAPTAANPAGA